MRPHPLAGRPVPDEDLANIPALVSAYYTLSPDPEEPAQRVSFGTSGHRGSAPMRTFNEDHIAAICQAIADCRRKAGIDGPLFLGKDTHALSEPAFLTSLEVLAANEIDVRIQNGGGYTPTPVVSHAILTWNRGRSETLADGIVITPSHNPPQDGGIKYNPPQGGPADTATTTDIARRANRLLSENLRSVRRLTLDRVRASGRIQPFDFIDHYVSDLENIVDMKAIRQAGLRLGVDPMGGSGIAYWDPIADRYGLDIVVVNRRVDPTFSFMPLDRDGVVRMDCSSPFAMSNLIALKDRFDIAFANDPDYDRHGIVTAGSGLLNPNHYLAVAVDYLFSHREQWGTKVGIGKTLVTSSMIDRVAAGLGREIHETPVGFKWFVNGLLQGTLGFGGEESAGASFLRRDGTVWTTDKDGIIMDLLAAEITAVLGQDPGARYRRLEDRFGSSIYERTDAPIDDIRRQAFSRLNPEKMQLKALAGEPVLQVLTRAPGNDAPIGGLKIVTASGWFAARPSGTENIYKIYAESFMGLDHLRSIQAEAQVFVDQTLADCIET
ncbi:MAG: alpha-D-glucose phosphate-specific phosphoglucomutase [Deltaproteobacteria bacterium]|nr:alpha-D-glucose phosphate-specific phosphoglucomutase [Deltaproteobacteria bacterium]